MAGFQVANFNFGQNIKKNELEAMRIASQNAQANQQAALQARGQDIQTEQAEAQRAAQAERENADRASREEQANATRAEQARQFDIESERKDRKFAAERKDKERAQSWDDALKQQQMEAEDLKFHKWQTEMEEFVAKGQRDREEYEQKVQAQKDLRESALGIVSEGVLLSGDMGGFTPSQTSWFNEKYGTQYDCIGKRDMLTGEEYGDGLIHLVQYQKNKDGQVVFGYLDSNGNVVEDTERKNPNSQPLVLADNTISKEDFNLGISRLRNYAGRIGTDRNGLTFDERKSLSEDVTKRQEAAINAKKEAAIATAQGQQARLAASIAKNMPDIKRGLKMNDEQASAFQQSLTKILTDAFNSGEQSSEEQVPNPDAGGKGGDKATIKSGDNTHDEGTQEPPNGEYHTVKDGVSYHWGKSKSGKYGYFPDK